MFEALFESVVGRLSPERGLLCLLLLDLLLSCEDFIEELLEVLFCYQSVEVSELIDLVLQFHCLQGNLVDSFTYEVLQRGKQALTFYDLFFGCLLLFLHFF